MKFDVPKGIALESKIIPVKVTIFYVDGKPYLDYIGNCETNKGTFQIHFPKISLEYDTMELIEEEFSFNQKVYNTKQQMFLSDSNNAWSETKLIKRKVSIKDLEKELGYEIEFI